MPLATLTLVLVNTIIYILLALWGVQNQVIYENLSLTPIKFVDGAFWQPVTSLFLHSPHFPLHLIVNMIGLWSFGSLLERQIGKGRFVSLYMASGLLSSLFVILIPYALGSHGDQARPTIGASGALLGLLGSMAILHPNAKLILLFFPIRARNAAILLGIGSLLFALFSPESFISHNGHLGGLIGGILYSKLALAEFHTMTNSSSQHRNETNMAKWIEDAQERWKNFSGQMQTGFERQRIDHAKLRMDQKIHPSHPHEAKPEKVIYPLPKDISSVNKQVSTSDTLYPGKRDKTKPQTQQANEKQKEETETRANKPRLVYDPSSGEFRYKT